MINNTYTPDLAIHPGRTLQDILNSLEMKQVELSMRTGLTTKTINEIVQGKNPLSPDTAIKLSEVFGMSASFWNNLQKNYEETVARLKAEEKIVNELPLLKNFVCYNELVKFGYVKKTNIGKERIANLLNFFGVSSLKFVQDTYAVAYRRSKYGNLSNESLAAWLRCGELAARDIDTEKFDEGKLSKNIDKLKKLTTKKAEIFQKELINICKSCGIAVVFIPHFKKTFVNGATRWLSPDKAMIQLSLRGSYVDIFWFTFFHELAHLLKHGKKEQFVEFENGDNDSIKEKEEEANNFACDAFIPQSDYLNFKMKKDYTDGSIREFAGYLNISPGIVAGRLGHDLNMWNKFAHLRQRLEFASGN